MARPGRHCPVCDADLLVRTQIEALRESNHSYREIDSLVPGFDVHKIRRHFKHVGKAAAEVTKLSAIEQSELRLTELANRAEESWIAAAASGDSRAALDVLKSQIRLSLDMHSRLLEKQEAAAEKAEENDAPSPAQLDAIVKRVRAAREAAVAAGAIWCPLCSRTPISLAELAGRFPEAQQIYEKSRNN